MTNENGHAGAGPPTPAGDGGQFFKWETLEEADPHVLRFQGQPVPGKTFEVELTSGTKVRVWRSDDGQQYFCHGLSFGGKEAPGGPISPYTGEPVEAILREHYQMIPNEASARPGDVFVWRGLAPESTPHSAVLTEVVVVPGKDLLDQHATTLRTKNGLSPETDMTLIQLLGIYGETYNVYRRR